MQKTAEDQSTLPIEKWAGCRRSRAFSSFCYGDSDKFGQEAARVAPFSIWIEGLVCVYEFSPSLTGGKCYESCKECYYEGNKTLPMCIPLVGQQRVLQLSNLIGSVRCRIVWEALLSTLNRNKVYFIIKHQAKHQSFLYFVKFSKLGTAIGAFQVSISGTKLRISIVSFMNNRSLKWTRKMLRTPLKFATGHSRSSVSTVHLLSRIGSATVSMFRICPIKDRLVVPW